MDLIDRLRDLAARANRVMASIQTEEACKNAFVMPFLSALGYDVFNPEEVVPELIADVGTKKGEKVDYAIKKDGKIIILVECKWSGKALAIEHASQLFRYFTVTDARCAILTNGLIYQFFTDIDEPNKMDKHPFFVFDLRDFDESHVEELKKFSKPAFDIDKKKRTPTFLSVKFGVADARRVLAEAVVPDRAQLPNRQIARQAMDGAQEVRRKGQPRIRIFLQASVRFSD